MDPHTSIQTIDLSAFSASGNTEQRQQASKALYEACHDFGFVQIVGHGVLESRLREAFEWSKKLYLLSHEDKMKAPHPAGSIPHRGYSHPGLEKVYSKAEMNGEDAKDTNGESLRKIMDHKESYEIGSENNPTQPNIWLPEDVLPGFRYFMTNFYWELHRTACFILEAIGESLNLTDAEKTHLEHLHSGTNNQLRLLHYPPIAAEQLEKQTSARMPAHNDWSSFTMLFQDDCGGLEFEDPTQPGLFVPAKPTPGSLLLNVGDMLQRFSNDIFPSATHRVTLPPPDLIKGTTPIRMTPARYSIPYFVAPDNDETVSCLPSCVTADRPAKFQPVTFAEYGSNIGRYSYKRGK